MVKFNTKLLTSFILLIFCLPSINAQNEELNDFDYFAQYSNWGFSVATISYREPLFTKNNVTKIVTDRYKGTQIAVKYHYNTLNEWSFNAGVELTLLHPSKIFFTLNSEDVFNENQRYFEDKLEGELYMRFPVSAEIKKRLGDNIYFNFNAGMSLFFMVKDFDEIKYVISNESLSEEREVFSLAYNDDILGHLNATFSSGIYIMFNDFMLQTNIIYDKALIKIFDSEYEFNTLSAVEPIKGDFTFSGDYIGFSVTIYLKRKGW